MKKIILTSIVAAISLNAMSFNFADFSIYPLNKKLTSISRGGTLPDKKAISDGVGTLIIGVYHRKDLSNKTLNHFLLKYKNDINNGHNLSTLINDNIVVNATKTINNINSNGFSSSTGATNSITLKPTYTQLTQITNTSSLSTDKNTTVINLLPPLVETPLPTHTSTVSSNMPF